MAPTSFPREHRVPQIESAIVDHGVLIQENVKQNAQVPFDNTRSLSACWPFGLFFFFLFFGNVKETKLNDTKEKGENNPPSWITQARDLRLTKDKASFPPSVCGLPVRFP